MRDVYQIVLKNLVNFNKQYYLFLAFAWPSSSSGINQCKVCPDSEFLLEHENIENECVSECPE